MSWKKLSSRSIYENDWMQVREDHVINPGGGENLYGHIHFKNVAVAIIALDEADNTWLVGQDRYTLSEYSWELPMGGAPLDEPPLVAAKRELCEETGIGASNWEEIMRLHPSNSITDELGFAYLATDLSFGETNFEETEDLEIRKLPLEEAVQMVIDGQITDAISAAALLRVYAVRKASSQ
ncbi:MAG: NUDIX hydrolase [Gammaproteobacteria bacterium]|nr:NUDIX hydrolase [Gammaproteobacteria bacterium]